MWFRCIYVDAFHRMTQLRCFANIRIILPTYQDIILALLPTLVSKISFTSCSFLFYTPISFFPRNCQFLRDTIFIWNRTSDSFFFLVYKTETVSLPASLRLVETCSLFHQKYVASLILFETFFLSMKINLCQWLDNRMKMNPKKCRPKCSKIYIHELHELS